MSTILVVEDDRKIAMALSVRLKAEGYDVHWVSDAVQAVAMAVKLRPDLVILDIGLPGGGGLLAGERIRNVVSTPVQFIVLTASKRAGLEEEAYAMGAVAFFEKPYDAGVLLASIAQALRKPQ